MRHYGTALFRTKVCGTVIFFAGCFTICSYGLGSFQSYQLASSVSSFAPTYASELQYLNHAAIRDASQSESPEYLAIIEREEHPQQVPHSLLGVRQTAAQLRAELQCIIAGPAL